jgi:DNA-binding transcriptional regulator GbsR (MarR family)
MKKKIKHPKLSPQSQPELRALADGVGQFIEYWGFKAVQGRLWCYLYLSKEPLSSIQLSQLLKVSPALITQSVQILLKYRVILEAEKGVNGVLRFRANPNVSEAIGGVLAGREALLMEEIQGSVVKLRQRGVQVSATPATGIELDPSRVEQVTEWVKLASQLLAFGIVSLQRKDNPFEEPQLLSKALEVSRLEF